MCRKVQANVEGMPQLASLLNVNFLIGGEVAASIADVGLLEAQLPRLLQLHQQDIQRAPLLILDGNMPQQTILVRLCLPVWLPCEVLALLVWMLCITACLKAQAGQLRFREYHHALPCLNAGFSHNLCRKQPAWQLLQRCRSGLSRSQSPKQLVLLVPCTCWITSPQMLQSSSPYLRPLRKGAQLRHSSGLRQASTGVLKGSVQTKRCASSFIDSRLRTVQGLGQLDGEESWSCSSTYGECWMLVSRGLC